MKKWPFIRKTIGFHFFILVSYLVFRGSLNREKAPPIYPCHFLKFFRPRKSTMMIFRIASLIFLLICSPCFAATAAPVAACTEYSTQLGDWLKWARIDSGDWRSADGQVTVDAIDGRAMLSFGKSDWQNYEISATAQFDEVRDPGRWLAIVFRSQLDGAKSWSQYTVRLGSNKRSGTEITTMTAGGWKVSARGRTKEPRKLGEQFSIRVVVRGGLAEGYLNDKLTVRWAYGLTAPRGCLGLAVDGAKAHFSNLKVCRLPDTPPLSSLPVKACEVVAHRGFSGIAPENTCVSAKEAIRIGATGSECDLYETTDGVIVLFHDRTIDRTTNGTGPIREQSYETLRKLDAGSWKDPKYAGEPVPTLEAYLKVMKNSGCTPVLEIKMAGITEKVLNTVKQAEILGQVAVIAFDQNIVREFRQLVPEVPCAWIDSRKLGGTPDERADWIATTARQNKTDIVDLNYTMVDRKLVDALHCRGIAVWVWTVNDPVIMETLMRWGIDSITTDWPDRLIEVHKKHGLKIRRK
jgi:glycerophosphoryl diester phosphodiesterase